MLSFGIELSRAFWIAVASVAFPSGSGPPSRAATMIALESFEKSFPRFASAAPFLCLMLDHLLCPDMGLLPDQVEKPFVHPRVIRQLRMERGDEEPTLPEKDRVAVELGKDLDAVAHIRHTRCTDEHSSQRLLLVLEGEIGLEARHLSAVGVPVDADVHLTDQAVASHEDQSRAGAEHRTREFPERLLEGIEADQPADRGRLPAGDDEAV